MAGKRFYICDPRQLGIQCSLLPQVPEIFPQNRSPPEAYVHNCNAS